jgi:hypothetical protein
MDHDVGKDLYSVCGKCGPTYHVIVARDAAKVTKVQCKQCMGYHRYRAPPGESNVNRVRKTVTTRRAPVAAQTQTKSQTKGKAGSTGRTTKRKLSQPAIDPDLSRPVRRYAISDTYEPGERIEHPKFGQGVVEAAPTPGKMDVFFEDGRRTLIQGRDAGISP